MEKMRLCKNPENRNMYGWYSMIGRTSNSWRTADFRAQTWCRWRFMARKPSHGWSVSPTLRQNHMIFFRPKHANVPLNHDCHDYQHSLKSFLCREKKKSPGEDCSMAVRRCGVSNVKLQGWWPHLESILSPWAHMTCAPWACWVNLRGGGLSSWSSYWICDGGAVRWCHDSNWSILLLSQRWKSKQSHFLLSGPSMIMPIRCMMLRSYLEDRFWRSFQVPAIQHRQSM